MVGLTYSSLHCAFFVRTVFASVRVSFPFSFFVTNAITTQEHD